MKVIGRGRHHGRIVVAGLGNELLSDDGVGVHVVRRLASWRAPRVLVAEVGTAALEAISLFDVADLVIAVDAMQAGGPPGTVYRCRIDDLARPEPAASLHDLSLVTALAMARPRAGRETVVLGVEPARLDYGLKLSAPVAAALPLVVDAVMSVAAVWRSRPGPKATPRPS